MSREEALHKKQTRPVYLKYIDQWISKLRNRKIIAFIPKPASQESFKCNVSAKHVWNVEGRQALLTPLNSLRYCNTTKQPS
jgi:hypothetical protein